MQGKEALKRREEINSLRSKMKLGNIFAIIAIIFGVLSLGTPAFTQEIINLQVAVWSIGIYITTDGATFFGQFFVGGVLILAGVVLLGLSIKFIQQGRLFCLLAGGLLVLGTLLTMFTWGIQFYSELEPFYGLYLTAGAIIFAFLAATPKRGGGEVTS